MPINRVSLFSKLMMRPCQPGVTAQQVLTVWHLEARSRWTTWAKVTVVALQVEGVLTSSDAGIPSEADRPTNRHLVLPMMVTIV